jgi:hypothetical protein
MAAYLRLKVQYSSRRVQASWLPKRPPFTESPLLLAIVSTRGYHSQHKVFIPHNKRNPVKIPNIKFPTIPSLDLTKIDAQKVLSQLPRIPTDRAKEMAKDAAYTTVGFGVLAFQKSQVRRQEVVSEVRAKLPVVAEEAVAQASAAITNLRRLVSRRKPTTEQHN